MRSKLIKQTADVCSVDAQQLIIGAHWFIHGFWGGERGGGGSVRVERAECDDEKKTWPRGDFRDFDLRSYDTERCADGGVRHVEKSYVTDNASHESDRR